MTEIEWQRCQDPAAMLGLFQPGFAQVEGIGSHETPARFKASDRKLRLFTAASLRYVLGRGDPPPTVHQLAAISELERFADDGNEDGLFEAWEDASLPRPGIALATRAGCRIHAQMMTRYPMVDMKQYECGVLRDIIGNPWRPAAAVCPTGTPQQLLGHLLDVTKTDSLGGMSVYDAGKERKLDDDRLGVMAEALQNASYEERHLQGYIGRQNLTITHWHTGNGHLSSSFQLMAIDCEPGEPIAWQIHLKNEVADAVIRRVAGDLLVPSWFTPTVRSLAQAAYEDRLPNGTLDPLTLLAVADALEETGCTNEAILRHLRGEEWCPPEAWRGSGSWRGNGGWIPLRSPHVRGCWAIDLLLGKGITG